MQINIDMGQMAQENAQILQMCAEHNGCIIDCPMKSSPIQMQTSVWTCEHTEVDNASKV